MPLATGTTLGPYEVLGPLGAGGMGEVDRARDSRLGRDVAIKVLPATVASSPERLARFEREAKTAGIALLKVATHLRPLHADARWLALLRRVRLEP